MPSNRIKSMSYGSVGYFCFMCHYNYAYRGQDTRSAKMQFLEVYPYRIIRPRYCSASASTIKIPMHNCSDMNPVSEQREQDSILSVFT